MFCMNKVIGKGKMVAMAQSWFSGLFYELHYGQYIPVYVKSLIRLLNLYCLESIYYYEMMMVAFIKG